MGSNACTYQRAASFALLDRSWLEDGANGLSFRLSSDLGTVTLDSGTSSIDLTTTAARFRPTLPAQIGIKTFSMSGFSSNRFFVACSASNSPSPSSTPSVSATSNTTRSNGKAGMKMRETKTQNPFPSLWSREVGTILVAFFVLWE